jgi:hypothetical protein
MWKFVTAGSSLRSMPTIPIPDALKSLAPGAATGSPGDNKHQDRLTLAWAISRCSPRAHLTDVAASRLRWQVHKVTLSLFHQEVSAPVTFDQMMPLIFFYSTQWDK